MPRSETCPACGGTLSKVKPSTLWLIECQSCKKLAALSTSVVVLIVTTWKAYDACKQEGCLEMVPSPYTKD